MTVVQQGSQATLPPVESERQSTFTSFPEGTLLEAGKVPITETALREGQCTNPIYRVHRWFARRLGSQFRAILTGQALRLLFFWISNPERRLRWTLVLARAFPQSTSKNHFFVQLISEAVLNAFTTKNVGGLAA